MSFPVIEPRIPFVTSLPGGLRHGVMIRVTGEIPRNDRFVLTLQTGSGDSSDDQPFHLSVRPSENVIVRNHFHHNGWGPEERAGGCPIQVGQPFTILILAQTDCYKIAVNNAHFCEFRHRLALSSVRYLRISGCVRVNSITLENDMMPISAIPPQPLHALTTSMPTFQPIQPIHPIQPIQPVHGFQPPPYPSAPSFQPSGYQPMHQEINNYPHGHQSMSASLSYPSPIHNINTSSRVYFKRDLQH